MLTLITKAFRLIGCTYGQIFSFQRMLEAINQLMAGGLGVKQAIATLLAAIELFGSAVFSTPITPRGDAIDLTGYTLVFEDNFDGGELDTDAWFYRCEGERRCGFNGASQVEVKDGNLVLTGEYLENGEYGAGWYTGMVALQENYLRGYYEIRCKCNKGDGFWSAFWLQAVGDPYDHVRSNGGIENVEVDIFESTISDHLFTKGKGLVYSTIHCNGYDDVVDKIDSQRVGTWNVDDVYDYNTYGLLWTENEYIFYVNGIEAGRTSFGKGVCINPEVVIVSLEIPENLPEEIASNLNYSTEMVVDYVKIYQLAD